MSFSFRETDSIIVAWANIEKDFGAKCEKFLKLVRWHRKEQKYIVDFLLVVSRDPYIFLALVQMA